MTFGSTPSANDLGSVITSAAVRRGIYATYVILLVVAGAAAAAFSVLGDGLPTWLLAVNAVLLYLGIPVGGLAIANVGTAVASADRGE